MRIFFTILIVIAFTSSFAQVGINTDNPDQALDVDGKVKIGNDGRTPTEGTIRYGATGDFEGYTAEGWNSFTEQNSGPLPGNPVPLTGFLNIISPGQVEDFYFYDWDGNFFLDVPIGKKVIVTGIYPSPNSAAATNDFYALSIASYGDSGSTIRNYSRIRISSYDNESRYISGDQAPLIVLNEGERVKVFSYGTTEITMAVSLRGFLVDNLEYD